MHLVVTFGDHFLLAARSRHVLHVDQTSGLGLLEMEGSRRLRQVDRLGERREVERAMRQRTQDEQAGFVAERLHDADSLFSVDIECLVAGNDHE